MLHQFDVKQVGMIYPESCIQMSVGLVSPDVSLSQMQRNLKH